jgi:hypothetical protein
MMIITILVQNGVVRLSATGMRLAMSTGNAWKNVQGVTTMSKAEFAELVELTLSGITRGMFIVCMLKYLGGY